jgi:hypothetical protein
MPNPTRDTAAPSVTSPLWGCKGADGGGYPQATAVAAEGVVGYGPAWVSNSSPPDLAVPHLLCGLFNDAVSSWDERIIGE